jgi:hypothetical protein
MITTPANQSVRQNEPRDFEDALAKYYLNALSVARKQTLRPENRVSQVRYQTTIAPTSD